MTWRGRRHLAAGVVVVAAVVTGGGCAREERPRTLGARHFVDGTNGQGVGRIPVDPGSRVDRPGLIAPDAQTRVNVVDLMRTDEEIEAARAGESVRSVSPTVERGIRPYGEPPPINGPVANGSATRAGTQPAAGADGAGTRPAGAGFLTLGAVVADVNGEAIFADQVIEKLEPQLAAEARNLDEQRFRTFATQQIARQVANLIEDKLEFATAQRNLDAKEKELVQARAMAWRQEQVTAAGGSLEAARRTFADEDKDFEEAVADYYRTMMVRYYYQKKVFPQIAVTAEQVRAYYDRNVDKEFTEYGTATFRLIKVDPRRTGGDRSAALAKAELLRARAAAGEDFAALAREGTDPNLARTGGQIPPIQRGSFAVEKVEQAVWRLQPGEVSEVIDGGDAYYVAKLESRQEGRVRPFEDAAVQAEIDNKLRSEQFGERREKVQEALLKGAIVRGHPAARDYDPALLRPAVEIAMQRYPAWRGQ
jgi:parvulin-like peptidyl-prolyl isomerase